MMQGLVRGLTLLDNMEAAQPSLLGADFFKDLEESKEKVDDDLGKGKIEKEDQVLLDKHGIDLNQLNAMRKEWSTDKMGRTFDEFLDLSLRQDDPYTEKVAQLKASKQAGIKEEGLAIITAIDKNRNEISDIETQVKEIQATSGTRQTEIADLRKTIDAFDEAYGNREEMPRDQLIRYDSMKREWERLNKIENLGGATI